MRTWWKTLGLLAGLTCSLGLMQTAAYAQGGMMGPPPGGGGFGMPPGGMMGPPPGGGGFGMPPGGMMGPPPGGGGFGMPPGGMMGPPPGGGGLGMPPGGGMMGMGAGMPPGMGPGAFGAPPPGKGAEFPNSAPPSQEPASPFSIKDEGMPNAFTELNDPRPRIHAPYVLAFRSEYVGWRLPPGPINVPLVTTTANPSLTSFGQLGDANTQILVNSGGEEIDYKVMSGFRLTMAAQIGVLPPIEVSGFLLKKNVTVFSGGSLTDPDQLLGVPFQDIQNAALVPGAIGIGIETALSVALPPGSPFGARGGLINITSEINFSDVEFNVLLPLNQADQLRLQGMIGYRHVQLDEKLMINTQSGGRVGNAIFNNTVFAPLQFTAVTADLFKTTNSLNYGQIGLRAELNMGRWSLFSDVKTAVGQATQRLQIAGSSALVQTVQNRTINALPGGIFALPSNSGSFGFNEVSFLSEANLALSFQWNHCIRTYAGYNVLYLNSVTRPGDHISGTLDARQIPTVPGGFFTPNINYNGPVVPSISHRQFVAQGIFFGVEFGF